VLSERIVIKKKIRKRTRKEKKNLKKRKDEKRFSAPAVEE